MEKMRKVTLLILIVPILIMVSNASAFDPSGLLEIHYINVGWGTAVLIIGPDGTRILMDGGRDNMGTGRVVPYMQSMNLLPSDGLHYILASHQHSDHIAGLTEAMIFGYDVTGEVYYNGSDYQTSYVTAFFNAAAQTSAGPAQAIGLGVVIQLGDSATATCVCRDGYVVGRGYISGSHDNENDRSIGILIKYRNFEYIFAGDLGGGDIDNACTGRNTNQIDVEGPMAQAIMPGGQYPLLTTDGVEVLHVNHHGSESSMNSDYMDYLTPAIACISTGSGQSPDYMFPRQDVVDNVLLSTVFCVSADPAMVLQSEEGQPSGTLTSFSGFCVGNIKITTAGISTFTIMADGQVTEGPDERTPAGLPLTLQLDGAPLDIVPPLVTVISPNGGETWYAGSSHDIIWNATDSMGVTSYAIDYSTNSGSNWITLVNQANGNPGNYSWNLPQVNSASCLVRVISWDDAGNFGNDISNNVFSIIPSSDSSFPTVTVLAPDGGETWFSGEVDTIRWIADDDIGVTSYSISYSTNGGGSWIAIQARTDGNPQIYPWMTPNINSSNCRIRVIVWDDAQHLASDMSNAPFSIRFPDYQGPAVDIIVPDGGELWRTGTNRTILWSATDTSGVDSVSLQYSTNYGQSWNTIFPFTRNNPGSHQWTVPNPPSRQSLIRIVAKDMLGNQSTASSESPFTIRRSPTPQREVRATPIAR
jgi:beta-lactamase superfamily II metal-dependent hydrolase